MRRALLQWKRPDKRRLVIEALKEAGREDLIGYGPECLVRPDAPAAAQAKNAAEKPPEPKKPQNKQGWAKAKPKRIPVRARESGDGMGECLKIVIKYLPVLLGVMSVISFTLMGIDKAKARRGSRRIPEKTLFLFTPARRRHRRHARHACLPSQDPPLVLRRVLPSHRHSADRAVCMAGHQILKDAKK